MFALARKWSSCVALIGALAATAACGSSSSTNVTAPTTARCALTLNGVAPVLASSGGAGTVDVGINRECTWSAKPDVPWITVSPASGQGDAQVAYSVAANPLAVQRTGAIVVNERRLEVTQRAACLFTVTPTQAAVSANGARVTVNIGGPAECVWTAASSAPWISIAGSATGTGAGTATLEVAPNAGPERSAEVVIAGVRFRVSQNAAGAVDPPVTPTPPTPGPPTPTPDPGGCEFSLSSSSQSIAAVGGSGAVRVNTTAGCSWSATSAAPWLTIVAGTNGPGTADVQFSAAPNTTTAPRNGTLTIAGLTFTVSQAGGAPSPTCTFALSSTGQTIGAEGGAGSIDVSAADGCAWEAASNAEWLTITAGSSATGNGTVRYAASANSGASPRSAVLTIAKQSVTVTQAAAAAPACTFTVAPATVDAPAGGVSGSITLTASDSSCIWTASSKASWISVTSASTGNGSASIAFTVAENTATTTRSGSITVGGQTVTVDQAAAAAPACTFSVAPTTSDVPAGGGTTSVALTASDSSCAWTASTDASWISVTSASTGTGSASITFAVAENTATTTRSGAVTVGGQTITVNQAAAAAPVCTYSVAPTTIDVPAAGGTESVALTASDASCAWTASTETSWISVTSASTGTGSASITFAVAENTATTSRSGAVTVGGQSVTVDQAAAAATPTSVSGELSQLQGTCPSITFVVAGRNVRTTATTSFQNGSCGSLTNGRAVQVEGVEDPDGTIAATRVTRN